MSSDQAELTFVAGRRLWNPIRNAVKECQFHGREVTITEGEGFLKKPFWIKGDPDVVWQISQWLDSIKKPTA